MKKLLLSLFVTLFALGSFAQDIIILDTNGTSIVGDTVFLNEVIDTNLTFEESFENKGFSTIINGSNDSMTIALIRFEESIVPGTGDALCWGNTCYGEKMNEPVWFVGDTVRIAAGDTAGSILGGFVTYHYPHRNVGTSIYRYEFYDLNNSIATSSELYVQYSISYLTGVDENSLTSNQVSIYPNPALDNVSIKIDADVSGKNKQIQVKDLTGKLVQNVPFSANSNKLNLDVSSFESGIYFVNILVENKNVITKKLIVQ